MYTHNPICFLLHIIYASMCCWNMIMVMTLPCEAYNDYTHTPHFHIKASRGENCMPRMLAFPLNNRPRTETISVALKERDLESSKPKLVWFLPSLRLLLWWKNISGKESLKNAQIQKPLMGRKRLSNTNVQKRNVKNKKHLEEQNELADRVSSDLPSNPLLMWKSLLFVCVFSINSRGFCWM